MVADQDASGRRVPQRARARAVGRAASTAATPGWSPSARPGWHKRLAERDSPPARSCASTMPSLEDDPDRIFVELQTSPMFGGRKVVRATAGRRVTAALLKPLVEGGELAGHPDRRGRQPAARRCAARAVREIRRRPPRSPAFPTRRATSTPSCARCSRAAKLQITPEAKRLLLARLGADRGAVAGRDREARALRARQERDRREPTWRPRSATRPSWRSTASCWRRLPGGRPLRSRNATAASPRARARRPSSPRCSATSCGCIACAARSMPAGRMDEVMRSLRPPPHFKQKRRAGAAVPRLEHAQAQRGAGAHRRGGARRRASTARWRPRWRRTCCSTSAN